MSHTTPDTGGRMKTLSSLFYGTTWLIYIAVVLLNVLGVTHVPWNVAIAPLVTGTVQMIAFMLIFMTNKKEIEKVLKKEIDKRIAEEES